jgi:hypothetical protein
MYSVCMSIALHCLHVKADMRCSRNLGAALIHPLVLRYYRNRVLITLEPTEYTLTAPRKVAF